MKNDLKSSVEEPKGHRKDGFFSFFWKNLAMDRSERGRELPEICKIDLNLTYVSYLDWGYPLKEIIGVNRCQHPEYLFKNSIYVDFLKKLGHQRPVTEKDIFETEYYKSSLKTLRMTGRCRQNTSEKDLLKQCEYFLDLYQAVKRGTYQENSGQFVLSPHHSTDPFARVVRVSGTKYWMILDGHHRLACFYLMGQKKVEARILPFAQAII